MPFIDMTLNKLAEQTVKHFVVKTRTKEAGGGEYCFLSDDAPEALKDSIQKAHGDRSPNDFVYSTYLSLLGRMSDYELESIDDLENVEHEIIDNDVDVYTKGLTEWLDSDINNVYWLSEAMESYEPRDGFDLLTTAQHLAIQEVFFFVRSYLSSNLDRS